MKWWGGQKLQDGEDGIGALKKELDDLRYQIGGLTQQSNMMQVNPLRPTQD